MSHTARICSMAPRPTRDVGRGVHEFAPPGGGADRACKTMLQGRLLLIACRLRTCTTAPDHEATIAAPGAGAIATILPRGW